jgi:hypothetical protein
MSTQKCQRCLKPTGGSSIMSMFNTQMICMECKRDEEKDPRYQVAKETSDWFS